MTLCKRAMAGEAGLEKQLAIRNEPHAKEFGRPETGGMQHRLHGCAVRTHVHRRRMLYGLGGSADTLAAAASGSGGAVNMLLNSGRGKGGSW